jgi:hypothetical protein
LHENETLDNAHDFFVKWSHPTDGLEGASKYWLAISVGNSEWAAIIKGSLEEKFT